LARFLGSEAVSRASGVSGFAAFASGFTRFLLRELMRPTFLMRRPPAFAGDLPLQGCTHAGESSSVACGHD
jgi:hypothetical protein